MEHKHFPHANFFSNSTRIASRLGNAPHTFAKGNLGKGVRAALYFRGRHGELFISNNRRRATKNNLLVVNRNAVRAIRNSGPIAKGNGRVQTNVTSNGANLAAIRR